MAQGRAAGPAVTAGVMVELASYRLVSECASFHPQD